MVFFSVRHFPKNTTPKKEGKFISAVTFKAKESMNGVEEIIMTACEPESIFVLCISGVFDWEDAKNLARSIEVGNTISFHQGINDDH